ncbi:MAG TPA: tetratricopeptide repeat protein [Candidatus Limnocylindrales bacterium]|nr:tetratricopeptide repeat protein [Candidatus Limnocylindrales bacterium]
MNECQERGCPRDVDRDGYCRLYGHLCASAGLAPVGVGLGVGLGADLVPADGAAAAAASTPSSVPSSGARQAMQSSSTPTPLPPLGSSERSRPRWADLVDMPAVAVRDPSTAVLANPSVPEAKRFCSRCRLPVGRGRDGQPGRTEGFCPRDRTPFSFTPKLLAGDRVNQFEVLGCLAHGGVGWIYLARDLNLDGSWRVLKGLRDTGDVEAWEAVVAERRFLAQVDHPNIVKIYDFVQHPDPVTGAVAGYLVMEYVGGSSLHDILMNRRQPDGTVDPLPLPQVLAYGAEILTALDYLHGRGLLYCDLKPDNVIHGQERLKLIDLGAVRHQDDRSGLVWGASGYQAREVIASGPSVRSDLYSVGRTLAVLSLGVHGMFTRYENRLPDLDTAPLLAQEQSYHRLLRRATHPDPNRRFASAMEMREQLIGVLREVLSATDGRPRNSPPTLFGTQPRSFGTDDAGDSPNRLEPALVASALSVPLVDVSDPAASFLATLGYPDPDEVIEALTVSGKSTVEVKLRLVRAHIDNRDVAAAGAVLETLVPVHSDDWRVVWYQGVAHLAGGRPEAAHRAFDAVYAMLPGDLDVQLAFAVSAELSGDVMTAAIVYERVWLTNRDFVSAAFGLARIRLGHGDWIGAAEVLDSVPPTSSQYLSAQVASLRAQLRGRQAADTFESEIIDAGMRVARLGLDVERRTRARIEVLEAALRWVAVRTGSSAAQVLGCKLSERELRFGLEREYRALARLAPPRSDERVRLIDRANGLRPRTLI